MVGAESAPLSGESAANPLSARGPSEASPFNAFPYKSFLSNNIIMINPTTSEMKINCYKKVCSCILYQVNSSYSRRSINS
jgi:hypothetical protein